ncbi:4Fe-4S binding protein [Candidatus Solincola tengchongensis]|uniref:ATP-binding protein n=1 Tax=Candidatus Solincola tengchongensis TaxID=2900693 RepID=UPI00257956CE|nr:4Fe-4S binding protein [Candidatus Solincola tengchongensis]
MLRKIVHIDEEKCDGCGLCVEACAEGAIAIIDGKARLVSEAYCDGLGACLGECPRGAITILEREAEPFDGEVPRGRHDEFTAKAEARAGRPVEAGSRETRGWTARGDEGQRAAEGMTGVGLPCGCAGTAVRELEPVPEDEGNGVSGEPRIASRLRNWPVQLKLLPITAPYLKGAHLLLAADCTGFAFPEFHRELLQGKVLLVGCPKLDDASFYREKLAAIIAENKIQGITVVHMEVPCCFGLANLARQALDDAGSDAALTVIKLGVQGEVISREEAEHPRRSSRH